MFVFPYRTTSQTWYLSDMFQFLSSFWRTPKFLLSCRMLGSWSIVLFRWLFHKAIRMALEGHKKLWMS